ncbi:MAG: hypothetical protein OXN89_15545 [Bryobacterales bacterium]|nr:hypothetical protein [Bryobacterales bacterium]
MTSNSESVPVNAPKDEWYRRVSPRTVLVVLGTVGLLDLACYLAIVRPASRAAEVRDQRITALVSEVATARATVEALQGQASKIESADRDGNELVAEIALPRRTAFSDLLTELGLASSSSGIEMREASYAIAPLEDSEEYGVLAVDATFRGRYENLMRFLHHLDGSELFFIIGSLGATPRDDENVNELQISVRFDTLVRDL